MTLWLVDPIVGQHLRAGLKSGLGSLAASILEFETKASAEEKRVLAGGLPRNMTVSGPVAQINVEGTLTKNPDFLAMWFGGGNTTYKSITSALAIANADPAIKSITMFVDSPGGTVDGLFAALDAVAASPKPVNVRAARAQSAAFGLAAAATGKIEAENEASPFGSVGVATAYLLDEDVVQLTSTEAPDKRPDLRTEEGKATVIKELDAIHDLFVGRIAKGRGLSVATVNETFGRGATLLAKEAKARGMIDKIASAPRAVTSGPRTAADNTEKRIMKWEDYAAAHPDQVAIGTKAAREAGVSEERERVQTHLTYGEECGALPDAIKAIKEGTSATHGPTIAKYMTTGRNSGDVNARATETTAAAAAANKGKPGAAEATATTTDEEQVVAGVLKLLGGGKK